MAKSQKLSPAMQRLVRALETYGYVDPIRDGGTVGTVVALMDRGILREARNYKGVHFPATTPEQVWDEAHAEDARRDAEIEAYTADSTNWIQCHPDGDLDAHTRQTSDGRTILIEEKGFRFWHVYVGDDVLTSASGTWQEVRAAADNLERNQAHAEASTPCPAGHVAPKTDGGTCVDCEQPEGWGQPNGMLGPTEAELMAADAQLRADLTAARADGVALPIISATTTQVEVRVAVSVEHALTDVYALRELSTYPALPVTREWMAERLDRIEQALRGAL